MSRSLRLSLVQMRDAGSRDRCLDQAVDLIEQAAADGANVVCLQELFHCAYPCQSEDHRNFDHALSLADPVLRTLADIAARQSIVVVAPVFERRAAGVYHNTAVVFDADGRQAGIYRKMHIPNDPLFYEKFYFTPGDLGFEPIKTRFGVLGIGICWDQWFPETARILAMRGAEILLFPTAIGWINSEKEAYGEGQVDAWITSMRAHAIANGVWLGAANRIGIEDQLEFWGTSFIASPRGELVASADRVSQTVVSADCPLDEIDVVRTHWPFLRDRRIDAYEGLTRRWLDGGSGSQEENGA